MLLIDTEDGKREVRAVRGRGYAERGLSEWLMQLRVPWEEMHNFRKMESTGRPVAVPDTRTFPGWVELPETSWIGSYAGAPLRRKGKIFGFLNLSSEFPSTYQQAHAERLQVFADQAAIAIENARLYAQAQAEIVERKRAQAAERGFAKMKEEFVLSASHSLRTPLHTLKGYLELLGSGKVREPEREAEFLANAMENAQRIEQIVHELLDVAQMESEPGQIRLENVPVGDLIGSSFESLAGMALERRIRLVFENDRPHLRVAADRRRLSRAIGEVVENAIKFSPEGGLVTVTAVEDNGLVRFRISDQGPGIPEAELVSLFSSSDTASSGTVPSPGLGLYLAHAVIDAHHGQIRVESEVGQGTTFEVAVPRGS